LKRIHTFAAALTLGGSLAVAACGGNAGGPPSPEAGLPDGDDAGVMAAEGGTNDSGADSSDASTLRDSGVDASLVDAAPEVSTLGETGAPDAGLVCGTGTHECDGTSGPYCASNASPDTCGTSCTACYEPANGTSSCNGTSCSYACNAGYTACAGGCCACGTSGPCVLAQNQPNALAIAADDVNVYWTTSETGGGDGSILQASVSGGEPTVLYSSPDEVPNAIVAAPGDVFFDTFNLGTDVGRILQVPIGGGTQTVLWEGGFAESPVGLTLADGTAYFQDYLPTIIEPDGGPIGTAEVFSVPAGGGNPMALADNQPEYDLAELAELEAPVAVGGSALFFVDGVDGDVREVPIAGGSVSIFAASQYATALATDASNVYWTASPTASTGTVLQEPLDGGSPVTLVSNLDEPDAIAVDATNVYFATGGSGNGTVARVPIGGGTPTTLATGQSEPVGIALNSTTVFWVTFGDGKIQSVPK
jgi:hypothetical protein